MGNTPGNLHLPYPPPTASQKDKTSLPDNIRSMLRKGMSDGFPQGSLDLYSKEINNAMLPELCEWITKLGDKVKVLIVRLSHNNIASHDITGEVNTPSMKIFAEMIKSNKYIESINLNGTNINDPDIEVLAPLIQQNKVLKHLDLGNCHYITDNSMDLLLELVEASRLEYVDLEGTRVERKNPIAIPLMRKALMYGVEKLEFELDHHLNDENMIELSKLMREYGVSKLKMINFRVNELTTKGASVLFDTLRECNAVVSQLILDTNNIDDGCAVSIGEYLQRNQYIEDLNIEGNKITDKGVEILSEYLIGNTTLKKLHLSYNNGITDESTENLINIIKGSYITSMTLWTQCLSEKKVNKIRPYLQVPLEDREVQLKSTTKSAAKIAAAST